jgi:hypothetical protein
MSPYESNGASAAIAPRSQLPVNGTVATAMQGPSRAAQATRSHARASLIAAPPATAATPAAFAELANHLAQALMQGVQRVAELNIDTTRSLLARGGSLQNARLDGTADAWRFSWRSYQICATTAATILKLCQSQARTSFDELWRALEDGLAQMPQVDLQRVRETRVAFEAMRAAYSAYFDAALAAHRALLSLAAGAC